jgi:hypothetical protein
MWGISSLAENRLASDIGLCSVESVSIKPTSPGSQFLPLTLSTKILGSLLHRCFQKLTTFSPIVCPIHRDTLLIHALIPGTFTALWALSCFFFLFASPVVALHSFAQAPKELIGEICREKWKMLIVRMIRDKYTVGTMRRIFNVRPVGAYTNH